MGFLERRRTRQALGGSYGYELAALHLQLLVAMAAADHELRPCEIDELAQFIDRSHLDENDTARLDQLLRMLMGAPPEVEQLLEQLAPLRAQRKLATALVGDLERVACSDSRIDEREEALLQVVCTALGVRPRSLHRAGSHRLGGGRRDALQAVVRDAAAS